MGGIEEVLFCDKKVYPLTKFAYLYQKFSKGQMSSYKPEANYCLNN